MPQASSAQSKEQPGAESSVRVAKRALLRDACLVLRFVATISNKPSPTGTHQSACTPD